MLSEQFIREIKLKRDKISSYKEYPFNLQIVKSLKTLKLHPSVTFLVGENGSGKSTLLEAIAIASGFNPEGGTRNFNFATKSTHSELHEYIQLVRGTKRPKDGFFLRSESFYNVATQIEDLGLVNTGSYGDVSLHNVSHGESILSLFMNRFRDNSLFFLDEPEAALSPRRQMAILTRMHELVKENCQFIVATHSPILIAYPDSYIYLLNDGKLEKVEYTDTEHYQDMKNFMNKHEEMLEILMSED